MGGWSFGFPGALVFFSSSLKRNKQVGFLLLFLVILGCLSGSVEYEILDPHGLKLTTLRSKSYMF